MITATLLCVLLHVGCHKKPEPKGTFVFDNSAALLNEARSERDKWVQLEIAQERSFENAPETWMEREDLDIILEDIKAVYDYPDPTDVKIYDLERKADKDLENMHTVDRFYEQENVI